MPLHVYMYAKPPDKVVQELRHYLIYRSTETYVSIQSNVATMLSLSSWDLQKVKPFYIRDSLGVLDGNHFTDLCAISSYMQEMRCRYD